MKSPTVLDKLVLIKRVTGFVNLGMIPLDSYVEKANAYIEDLSKVDAPAEERMDLSEAQRAISAIQQRVMPSQEICVRSMEQVDAYLIPLRQARRESLAETATEATSPQRPRP